MTTSTIATPSFSTAPFSARKRPHFSPPRSDYQAKYTSLIREPSRKNLTETMIFGYGNIPGLSQINKVNIIGGLDNPAREGLVSIYVDDMPSGEIVKKLNNEGIRTHLRKADHYSGNILNPLKQDSCVRVSLCHYNSIEEVNQFLIAIKEICN